MNTATTPHHANLFPVKATGRRIHRGLTLALQGVMLAGLGVSIYEQQWLNSAAISGILLLTALPMLILRRLEVFIPPEFELLTIGFIFAALFLGETQDFYGRFWWWDLALHTTSGVLLGILGFLLVYVLNETPRLDVHMQPGFVAFFAFCFALTVGALWEVFEFAMDRLAGTTMQKQFLGDPSGLTDTMWDMIVDALGALAVALAGYLYLKRGMTSFIVPWIQRFIAGNPRLFRRGCGLGRRPPVDDAPDAAFGRKSLCRSIRVPPERACASGEGDFQ
jgi:hypothetical protein